jgi:ribonuclease E
VLRAGREAAIYVLNRKRAEIGEIEERYGVIVEVLIDEGFEGAKMAVESLGPPPRCGRASSRSSSLHGRR